MTIFARLLIPSSSSYHTGQGDCCDGRCRCRENQNGFRYRHNGTTENCACPPVEVACLDSVSCLFTLCILQMLKLI